jgi:alcohol dehydrogenase (cytochrome c)
MPAHYHPSHHHPRRAPLGVAALLAAALAAPAIAADVTADRLVNADKERGNWLMNHRTYDAQRFSPLDQINRGNVKGLKLAYAVALGGTAVNENLEATPLAEDGFIYVTDQWGVLYKIDARSGEVGRILWRMDPGQEKIGAANRGAALWGGFVITMANYPPRMIATDKDTGKVVWETNLGDGQPGIIFSAAPLAVKDKIVIGASGGDGGVRDYIVAVDAATGKLAWRKYVIPAPGEPGSETWKDKNNAWRTGGGAMWVTGSYDPATDQVIWGTGNPVPWSDPYYRPGDNLYTNSVISWDPDTGRMNWYHQYTPGDMWDYDEEGTHILIDGEFAGQMRKIVTHTARNGFLYSFERANGQTLLAKPYVDVVNWTAGIDQKTGKPIDYDPNRDVQVYSGNESDLIAVDPFTGAIKKKVHSIYPNNSGAVATAGGLVFTGFTDGTLAAYDDTSLEQLWKINVGTGFSAPPMTFEAGGKQYVAILTGLSRVSKTRHVFTPELREMRFQTMMFVFGL